MRLLECALVAFVFFVSFLAVAFPVQFSFVTHAKSVPLHYSTHDMPAQLD